MGVACLEFRGKSFRGWLKKLIAKFVKVVSLENFPKTRVRVRLAG